MNPRIQDPVRCLFDAQWGLARATAGLIAALAIGFLATVHDCADAEEITTAIVDGMIMAVGGRLFWVTIPALGFAIFWCIVLGESQFLVFWNLASLQAMNLIVSGNGEMNAWVVLLLSLTGLVDAAAVTLWVIRLREGRHRNLDAAND